MIASTVLGDLLQSFQMKQHGEIKDFHPRLITRLARNKYLILAVCFI